MDSIFYQSTKEEHLNALQVVDLGLILFKRLNPCVTYDTIAGRIESTNCPIDWEHDPNLFNYNFKEIEKQGCTTHDQLLKRFMSKVKVYFYILLFCDGLHDFGEKIGRNKLLSSSQIQLCANLNAFYIDLIKKEATVFYGYDLTVMNRPLLDNAFGEKYIKNAKENALTCIRCLGLEYMSLKDIGKIYSNNINVRCSKKPDYLKEYLSQQHIINTSEVTNTYILSVDAASSKYSTSSITNFLCDELSVNNKVRILDSVAANYDSANNSCVEKLTETFSKDFGITDNKIYENRYSYQLNINGEILIQYKYKTVMTYAALGRLFQDINAQIKNFNATDSGIEKWLDQNWTLYNYTNNKQLEFIYNNVMRYTPDNVKQEILKVWGNNASKFGNLNFFRKDGYIKPTGPGSKGRKREDYTIIYNNIYKPLMDYIIKDVDVFNAFFGYPNVPISVLQVDNYLGIANPFNQGVPFTSMNFSSTGQVSVANLTSDYGFQTAIDNNPLISVYYTSYKTIGDLGQIISTTNYSLRPYPYIDLKNNITLFISFDEICAYIASLFIPSTIYEIKGEETMLNPFYCFGTKLEIPPEIYDLTRINQSKNNELERSSVEQALINGSTTQAEVTAVLKTRVSSRSQRVDYTSQGFGKKKVSFKKWLLNNKLVNSFGEITKKGIKLYYKLIN